MIDANKLTRAQRRVMEYLVHGHRAHRRYGSVVYVNGGKIATVATMLALEARNLIKRDGDEWFYIDNAQLYSGGTFGTTEQGEAGE